MPQPSTSLVDITAGSHPAFASEEYNLFRASPRTVRRYSSERATPEAIQEISNQMCSRWLLRFTGELTSILEHHHELTLGF